MQETRNIPNLNELVEFLFITLPLVSYRCTVAGLIAA
jgi:hypothetical protein